MSGDVCVNRSKKLFLKILDAVIKFSLSIAPLFKFHALHPEGR